MANSGGCVSYFTLRWLSKKRTLWTAWVFITVESSRVTVTTNPSLAPASLPGLLSCLAVVGVGTWEPIPACCQRVLKIPTCAGSSRDLLPPSPPAEKATARQDQAGQATYLDFIRSRHTLRNALALSSYAAVCTPNCD